MDNQHNGPHGRTDIGAIQGDEDHAEGASRHGRNIVTAVATVAILGVASLSAYIMSGDTSVKPASGSAQALSLATSAGDTSATESSATDKAAR